jgi:hypothetical protein
MAAPAPSASAGSLTGEYSPTVDEAPNGEPPKSEDTTAVGDGAGTELQTLEQRTSEATAVRAADETALIVGGTLLILGAALIALRWTARRLA